MLEKNPKVVPVASALHQYLLTIVVNMLMLGYGISNGWPSPNIILLTSDESPLPSGKISMEEASWVASILCIGRLIGNIFFGFITNAFGRKLPLIFITIPTIIGWLLILYAKNVYYLYAARCMNGFIGGAFVLGNYCEYATNPKLVIILTVVCLVSLYFFPESPSFLMKQGKTSEIEKSIRFYQNRHGRANDEIVQSEIEKLKNSICGSKAGQKNGSSFSWSDLTTRPGRTAMIIGIVLATLNQMCGCFAMLNYTAYIFQEVGSSLSPNMSAIIVGIIQVFGSYAAVFLVERSGRKFLFVCSTIGTALGLVVLGGYVLSKQLGINVADFNWIPLVSFSFTIFIASWAVLTLPFLVISEVLPEKLKDFGLSCCMTIIWTLAFLMIKLLPRLIESFCFHGTMFFFAGCCLLSAAFIIAKMPETKGKSYDQIMKTMM